MIKAIRELVKKDLLITIRNPLLFILSIIIPVVFVFLYSLITQMSATNPIVLARNSYGPASDRFVKILSNMQSVDGKYFEIETMKAQKAWERYKKREITGLVDIPQNFDRNIEAGKKIKVKLYVHNLNSDATKNLQLRLDNAIYLFQKKYKNLDIKETFSKFKHDISMKLYVGVGLLMFGIIYSAIINTGNLLAREWEDRTAKMIILTPKGFMPLIIGKYLTAFLETIISSFLIIIVMSLTLDFPVLFIRPVLLLYFLILFFFGASLGTILGVLIKKTLPIVTLGATLSIFFYLVCGNESSLKGLAYGGFIEKLWRLSTYMPVTQITEQMRMIFIKSGESFNATNFWPLLYIIILSITLSTIALFTLKRGYSHSPGQ